jgi:hypothetical protein
VANVAGYWTTSTTGVLNCVDCHAGTYVGTAPSSGLHATSLSAMISTNPHDAQFFTTRNAATEQGDCETCHTSTPSSDHMTGALAGSEANFDAAVGYTDASPETCAPSGGMGGCHDDQGNWSRRWSDTADNGDGTECANCHGEFSGDGFVAGVSVRHTGTDAGGQIAAKHGGASEPCRQCHALDAGRTYYNFDTGHRDGNIQLNDQNGFVDTGATVYCTGCHTTPYGTDDGEHSFADVTASWARTFVAGPAGNCDSCHADNGAAHAGTQNKNPTLHDTHTGSAYVTNTCHFCHPHDGPGPALHANSTVNFGGTYMAAGFAYSVGQNFDDTNCGSADNACHDADAGEWVGGDLGGDSCVECHNATGKLLYTGTDASLMSSTVPPASAKHSIHLSNTSYVGGCADCHTHNGASGVVANHIQQFDEF